MFGHFQPPKTLDAGSWFGQYQLPKMQELGPMFSQYQQPKIPEIGSYFNQFQPPKTPEAGSSEVKNHEDKSQSKSRLDFLIFRVKDLQE